MTTQQDLNQITISGHVHSAPELHRYDDGDIACTLTLTHSTDHHQSGHWELQLYHVSLWGPLAEDFADTFEIGQRIVITGRLDCVHQQTLTGYQSIVSIIAERVITIPAADQDTGIATGQLALTQGQDR
jgi:single-stranded DNA-binding protein